jgi:hypothetical protein
VLQKQLFFDCELKIHETLGYSSCAIGYEMENFGGIRKPEMLSVCFFVQKLAIRYVTQFCGKL